jgi:hypothetical protein
MAKACLLIGWDRPHAGMYKEGMGALMESRAIVKNWQKAGWFESYELIGLTPHGGDLNGFILLKGERAKLDELRRTDEFEGFTMRLGTLLSKLGIVPGVTEAGVDAVMERQASLMK